MASKIINTLFILSLLYATRVITLKFGLLQPKSIQFYNTVVYRPDDFKISGFSLVPPFSSFILLSFSNFNKDVIEYIIKKYDTKSILVSFSNEHNEYLVSHWFKDKALYSIFDNNGMPDEEALRDWEFVFHVKYYTIDSKYKDTDKCIFYKKILQTKKNNNGDIEYELYIVYKGKYPYLHVTSSSLKYLDEFVLDNCGGVK